MFSKSKETKFQDNVDKYICEPENAEIKAKNKCKYSKHDQGNLSDKYIIDSN